MSNFLNVDVLSTGQADVMCTSLTKLVSVAAMPLRGAL
jgi:cystathionine beta-lyase/cystathionine gamma-synthase